VLVGDDHLGSNGHIHGACVDQWEHKVVCVLYGNLDGAAGVVIEWAYGAARWTGWIRNCRCADWRAARGRRKRSSNRCARRV
jgi:hypothetical protein